MYTCFSSEDIFLGSNLILLFFLYIDLVSFIRLLCLPKDVLFFLKGFCFVKICLLTFTIQGEPKNDPPLRFFCQYLKQN